MKKPVTFVAGFYNVHFPFLTKTVMESKEDMLKNLPKTFLNGLEGTELMKENILSISSNKF